MHRSTVITLTLSALILGSLIGAGAGQFINGPDDPGHEPAPPEPGGEPDVEAFSGPDEFAAYLARGGGRSMGTLGLGGVGGAVRMPAVREATVAEPRQAVDGAQGQEATVEPRRYAGTNVQVAGIDEPDIVKTDGRTVFYSPGPLGRPLREGAPTGSTAAPPEVATDRPIYALSAEDPASPELIGTIDRGGQLLYVDESVISIGTQALRGFDVAQPGSPTTAWSRPIDGQVVSTRLAGGQLYVVTRSRASHSQPCPIAPLGQGAAIECTDIHHPRAPVPVDVVYSVFAIDPASGGVEDSTAFVGSSARSVVYMSENGLYVTYQTATNTADRYIDFLLKTQGDRLDDGTEARLSRLRDYELSQRAKLIEVRITINRWLAGFDEEERVTIRNNLRNEFADYLAAHQRDMVSTGIVRIDLGPEPDAGDTNESLAVTAVGEVPGVPLNQFSLDEHDGNLRIATTIPRLGDAESANDLYVLNESLAVVGEVTDMGLDERIYSVRYVDDTAYVVTFRRIDPFHVVDLSDPTAPKVTGELKLPGFSSYLHPLDENRVLGIGEEDGRVKAVIFDVSDPASPTIQDSYTLDERWTAIQQTHHAFLLDRKHGVFFLPGSQGGYVMQYEDGLELERTVRTDHRALRARYIGDYLYVFAGQEVVVLDERTWERTETIHLE